jgi:hypothetical protein
MKKDDPYNDIKVIHLATLINDNGDVSPACAKKPRKLNLKVSTWTLRKSEVTCNKCKNISK